MNKLLYADDMFFWFVQSGFLCITSLTILELTLYTRQVSFELTKIYLPLPTKFLGLKANTTTWQKKKKWLRLAHKAHVIFYQSILTSHSVITILIYRIILTRTSHSEPQSLYTPLYLNQVPKLSIQRAQFLYMKTIM